MRDRDLRRRMKAIAAGLGLSALLANGAHAVPIQPTDFTASAFTESFEGLASGDPNTATTGFPGVLEVAVGASFRWSGSGAPSELEPILTNPVPNPGILSGGAFVHDFNIGCCIGNNWGANGTVDDASDVPFGESYLGAFGGAPTALEFTFSSDIHKVGAFVAGTPGTVTLDVYDSADTLLESLVLATGSVASWDSTFIGIERSEGIRRVVFTSPDFGIDNLMIDTPEPTTALMLSLGLAGLGLARRLQRRRPDPA